MLTAAEGLLETETTLETITDWDESMKMSIQGGSK